MSLYNSVRNNSKYTFGINLIIQILLDFKNSLIEILN